MKHVVLDVLQISWTPMAGFLLDMLCAKAGLV